MYVENLAAPGLIFKHKSAETMDAAHWSRHRQTFVKISEPGKHLKDAMVEPVRQQLDKYSERDDDSKLKILIDAADEWVISGSADADVDC